MNVSQNQIGVPVPHKLTPKDIELLGANEAEFAKAIDFALKIAHKRARLGKVHTDWPNRTPGEMIERIRTEMDELETRVYVGDAKAATEQAAIVGMWAMMVVEWYGHTLRIVDGVPSNPQAEVTQCRSHREGTA